MHNPLRSTIRLYITFILHSYYIAFIVHHHWIKWFMMRFQCECWRHIVQLSTKCADTCEWYCMLSTQTKGRHCSYNKWLLLTCKIIMLQAQIFAELLYWGFTFSRLPVYPGPWITCPRVLFLCRLHHLCPIPLRWDRTEISLIVNLLRNLFKGLQATN